MTTFPPIAIVGRACLLPGASSPDELWRAVVEGRDLVSRVPSDRWGIALEDVPFEAGADVPERVEAREEGMRLVVRPRVGQKTGHYTDQRENRRLVAEIARVPFERVTMATIPFLVPLVLVLLLITYVPGFSLWLPDLILGPET